MKRDEALNLLNVYCSKGFRFPEHDLVIKVPSLEYKDLKEKYIINEYTFKYLLCIAYGLTEKSEQ
jgi:hypothetical protein